MPRKIRPRANWRAVPTELPSPPYSDDDLGTIANEIEKVRGEGLSEEERLALNHELVWWVTEYWVTVHEVKGPGLGEIREALKEIRDSGRSFVNAVQQLDDMSIGWIRIQNGRLAKSLSSVARFGIPPHEALKRLTRISAIADLVEEADQALAQLDESPDLTDEQEWLSAIETSYSADARKRIHPPKVLTYGLAEVFKIFARTEPVAYWEDIEEEYRGNFVRFAMACIRPVVGYDLEWDTIGKMIVKLLQARRDDRKEDVDPAET